MKTKIFTLVLLAVLFSVNFVFSQKNEVFNKKMYLGINGAYNLFPIIIGYGHNYNNYSIDLEFERQFHKHWGYTAGVGIYHFIYREKSKMGSSWVFLEMPIGMKFYSKIINVSVGINTTYQLHYSIYHYFDPDDGYPASLELGPYLAISKDFTVARNFKIEPYILGSILWGLNNNGGGLPVTSVGLRLKYEFNNKQLK